MSTYLSSLPILNWGVSSWDTLLYVNSLSDMFLENSPTQQLLTFLVVFAAQKYFNCEDTLDGIS